MIDAAAADPGFGPLAWKIIPFIHLGPLDVSPHGVGIALAYLVGAQVMVRRARTREGPAEADIWNAVFYALIGAIAGARVGYVLGHFSEVTDGGKDLLGIFKVYEGGISLIGGITGGILASLPYVIKHKMGFWRSMDLAMPGLALGIVIGRIGDLAIGDHLGKRTDWALGWRCLGQIAVPAAERAPLSAARYAAEARAGSPPSLGCYAVTVHQTALYDFLSTLVLLGVLLYLGRKARNPGFLTLVFTIWYGTARLVTDSLRVDRRYLGLTGSQIMALAAVLVCLFLLGRYRGAPPRWALRPKAAEEVPTAESIRSGQMPPEDTDAR